MNRRKKVKRLGAKTISFPKGKGHLTHNNREFISKLINQYLLRGRKFVEYACFRYGYYNAQISGKIGNGFVDDFQYFVFTKSIKSLGSIRELLRLGHAKYV